MSKPVANLKSGSLCQFCDQMNRCLMESSQGEKDCDFFINKTLATEFSLNIKCRIEEARQIHADVTHLTQRCDFELARSLMGGKGVRIPFFRELRDALYQHLRRLNQILPKVANRKTPFTIVSRIQKEGDWKEGYKTVMNKIREHRTPEEASENIRSQAIYEDLMRTAEADGTILKEEKSCSSQSPSSPSSLPLLGEATKE